MTDEDFYAVKKNAIARIKEVAGEHFDGFVFIGRVSDPDDKTSGATLSSWDGELNQAIGLAHRAVERFRQNIIETDFPNDPSPDDDWKTA